MWREDLDRAAVMRALSHPSLAARFAQTLIARDLPELSPMAGVFSRLPNIGEEPVWQQFLAACDELTEDNRFGMALTKLCFVDANTYVGAMAQGAALSELATEPSDLQEVCLAIIERFEIERDWDSELALECQRDGAPEPDAQALEVTSGSLTIVTTSRAMAELSKRLTTAGAHDAMRRAAAMLAGTGFTLELLARPLPVFDGP